MKSESTRWTVHLVREDGRRSHTARVGPGLVAVVGLAAVILMVAGFGIGRSWAAAEESATVRALRVEVRSLRGEQARLGELASRLERVETEYDRLRGVLLDGAPARGVAIAVPPGVPGGDTAGAARTSSAPAWPVVQRGFVTRSFGSLGDAGEQGHTGIDIAVPSGSYVRAIRPGVVESSGEDPVYGLYVRIAHGDGLSSLYGHNSWLFAAVGDSVERLQVIALSGSTGRSTAPHLHFEITRDGVLLDPLAFVNEGAVRAAGGSGQNGVEQR